MKAILILNSPDCNQKEFEKQLYGTYYLVAVDGGINHVEKCCSDIEVDLHIGDMDSCHKSHHIVHEKITFPVEKDFSDYYLALEDVYAKGYEEVFVFGGTGGRVDHFLAVYDTTVAFAAKGLKINMVGMNETIYFRNKDVDLTLPVETTVSIFSGLTKLEQLSLYGFKYLVNKVTMERINPVGLSNVTTHESVQVEFSAGVAVIIVNH